MSDRKEHEKQHGAAIAHNAADIWGWGSPSGQVRAKRRSQLLIQYGRITKDSSVLDIGCGTGIFSRYFAEAGAKVTAIDISTDLLEQAKRETTQPITYILGDAENFPFDDRTFDVVVGSSVLHHLNPEIALKEIFRVLKPGGFVAFAEPNMMNPQIAIQKNIPFIKKMLGDSPDERAFVKGQAKRLLTNAGFTNVLVFPYDFLHPLVPKIFIKPISSLSRLLEKIPLIKEIAGSLVMAGRKPL
ncbi:MAG: class I SAM-dependent methyltransferase [Bacteroidota bacterium]|nr:class I SAM-dependent methyltransferase [Bacteroidota bacterium]